MSSIRPSTLIVALVASTVAARAAHGTSNNNATITITADKCTLAVNSVAEGATARVEVKLSSEATGIKVFEATTPATAAGKDFIVKVDPKKVPSSVETFAVEISKADGTKETRDCTGPKGKTFVSPKGDADSKNGAHDAPCGGAVVVGGQRRGGGREMAGNGEARPAAQHHVLRPSSVRKPGLPDVIRHHRRHPDAGRNPEADR